jgi:pyruvate/2-oxoglutarate dehydrogenase complex dihydrolipoamide acyltransferase (E2) component
VTDAGITDRRVADRGATDAAVDTGLTDRAVTDAEADAGIADSTVPDAEADAGITGRGTQDAGDAADAGDAGMTGLPDADPRTARREALRRSSPVAARLAAEHGLDVLGLEGTGRNGRVTKRDVLAAAAAGEALMHTESPYRHDPSIPVAGATGTTASNAPGRATSDAPDAGGSTDGAGRPAPGTPASSIAPTGAPPVVPADLGGVPEPASRMRRSIGTAVRRSLDTAAHCTTIVECDMSRVERERRELGLTALPLLARHAIETLRAFPALNATFDGETVTRYGERVHLGIAVSLGDDGLIAPVIHDAQDLSVQGLARRIKDLAARARAGRLSPDEVRGGTFTITNPGAAGALMATPVINLPQVAILDLEAIVRRPVVVTDAEGQESIGIRPMVHLCMGWDHRALDGLYAAQFLTALRRRVEG